jgi:hypothetical protein
MCNQMNNEKGGIHQKIAIFLGNGPVTEDRSHCIHHPRSRDHARHPAMASHCCSPTPRPSFSTPVVPVCTKPTPTMVRICISRGPRDISLKLARTIRPMSCFCEAETADQRARRNGVPPEHRAIEFLPPEQYEDDDKDKTKWPLETPEDPTKWGENAVLSDPCRDPGAVSWSPMCHLAVVTAGQVKIADPASRRLVAPICRPDSHHARCHRLGNEAIRLECDWYRCAHTSLI